MIEFILDHTTLIDVLIEDPNNLPPMDRASLLSDAFSLATIATGFP